VARSRRHVEFCNSFGTPALSDQVRDGFVPANRTKKLAIAILQSEGEKYDNSSVRMVIAFIVVQVSQLEPKRKRLWLRGQFLYRERFASAKLPTSSPAVVENSTSNDKGLNEANALNLGKVFQAFNRDYAYDHLPGGCLERYLQTLFL
jgi:hypothetical protein